MESSVSFGFACAFNARGRIRFVEGDGRGGCSRGEGGVIPILHESLRVTILSEILKPRSYKGR